MSDIIPVEALEKLNKTDLQKQYEIEIQSAPEDSLTKAQLIDAILANREIEGIQPDPPPLPPPPASEEKAPEEKEKALAPGDLKVVKIENGKVIDRSVISSTVWNNLPPGKHGWKLESPAELSEL